MTLLDSAKKVITAYRLDYNATPEDERKAMDELERDVLQAVFDKYTGNNRLAVVVTWYNVSQEEPEIGIFGSGDTQLLLVTNFIREAYECGKKVKIQYG